MRKPIILCVDDEKIILDSLKKELNSAFSDMLTVEIAESANEALELLNEFVKKKAEIPIIISDWLLPEMKGDVFLIKVHSFLPQTRKIMLTGQATTEGVGNAVNKAKLYRYIAKPWESEDLDLTVTEAFKSYYKEKTIEQQQKELKEMNKNLEIKVRQRTKELEFKKNEIKELLDKTIKGSINAVLDLASESNPIVFDRAVKIKDITKRIVLNLCLEPVWEYEIAALLSQIGCLEIDKDIISKYFSGAVISQTDYKLIKLHPEKTYNLLRQIPHLENVAEGIRNLFTEDTINEISFTNASQPNKISRILRIANDFELTVTNGKNEEEAFELIKSQKNIYDAEVINSLNEIINTSKSSSSKG